MQSQPLPQTDPFAFAVADIADALSARPGETQDQRAVRSQVATHLILELAPSGAIELMLAGHTVMFDALMTDSVRTTLRGERDTMRRGTRAGVVAMDQAFHRNMDRLDRYQADRADAGIEEPAVRTQAAPPAQPEAAPDVATRESVPASPGEIPATETQPQTVAQILDENPMSPEPSTEDRDAGSATCVAPSTATDPLAEAVPAATSANENDRQAPPRLNRAQRRLAARLSRQPAHAAGQHSDAINLLRSPASNSSAR